MHVEVRQEHDLHAAVDVRVVVDGLADGGDQLDDPLGHEVTRRRLAAEDEGARRDAQRRVLLEPVVQRDDVQHVEVLALVLVDALDLDVEHPVGSSSMPVADWTYSASRDLLARLTSRHRAGTRRRRRRRSSSRSLSRSVSQPSPIVSSSSCAQARVGQRQEAARRHAVGHVAEPLRPQLVEVFEHTGFQQFGVQRRDTVDGVAADRGQVRHPHALARRPRR